ncbi:hypothetical protein BDW69DRAFT_198625 [Aspergillus filifer]
MARPVPHAVFDDVDALNAPLAVVGLEGVKKPSCVNPFLPYLGPYPCNWKELLCGWLDFPIILLLNPSESDKLGYEEMIQQTPTLELELRDVIVMDTFPMVTNEMRMSKQYGLTLTCLRYIQPEILISCQCCSKVTNDKWGFFGDHRAEELSSSKAGARQELVKTVDIDGHQILAYNTEMEEVLKKLLTKVLGPFGRWKEQRVAKLRESARREVILVQEGVRDGMRALIKQMQLFKQICGQKVNFDEAPRLSEH